MASPLILQGGLTNRYYVVTKYTEDADGTIRAGVKHDITERIFEIVDNELPDREALARIIFNADPPSNPHGPNSDLYYGHPYCDSQSNRALRQADAILTAITEARK